MDRGFLFGDGVYEVIPAYGGRLFRLRHHLERLDRSLAAIRMGNPHTLEEWQAVLGRLVAQLEAPDQAVYLQITRGVASKRDHAIPVGVSPTIFAMTNAIEPLAPEVASQGVAAITTLDLRWQLCHVKAITLLANVLSRAQATEVGAVEAILVRDGWVTEGSASNLFIIKAGELQTPPKSEFLLPGVTRDLVLEIAAKAGIPVRETPLPQEALGTAEEIWLTSSTREILPVTRLDGQPVGSGVPGPRWREMFALYQEYKRQVAIDPATA